MPEKVEIRDTKQALRKALIEKRRNIADKPYKDSIIFEKLIDLPRFKKSDFVLTYVSFGTEVDTRELILYCFNNGIKVAVPGIVNEEMKFFLIESFDEIGDEVSDFTNSICIVPGLTFGSDNKRLGYGGGYYDRFLRSFCGFKVGLCYKELILNNIPTEKHDEGVDLVIWN